MLTVLEAVSFAASCTTLQDLGGHETATQIWADPHMNEDDSLNVRVLVQWENGNEQAMCAPYTIQFETEYISEL